LYKYYHGETEYHPSYVHYKLYTSTQRHKFPLTFELGTTTFFFFLAHESPKLHFISKQNYKILQTHNHMPRNRLPRIMKHYSPTGRRKNGRPLKRLLDTWDRNESTSGPTPWQMMMTS